MDLTQNLGMEGLDEDSKVKVLQVASQLVDRALEEEMDKLDAVLNDETELEKLRRQRIEEMRREQNSKNKWRNIGHGKLTELADQKDFFAACQSSERVVAIFTTPNNAHAATLCEHMQMIASKHIETRFIKLDAEKSPFLVDKLKIWMIPSTLLIKNEKNIHTFLGLDEISGTATYETWQVERALFTYEMVTHQEIEERTRQDNLDDENDDF